MKQYTSRSTTMVTFVLRFWREPSAGTVRWRGRVEHVESGKSVNFLGLEEMLVIFRQFGIGTNSHPCKQESEEKS